MYLKIVGLPRRAKSALIFAVDAMLVPLSYILACALRYGMIDPRPILAANAGLFGAFTLGGILLVYWLGLHRIKLQSMSVRAVGFIGLASFGLFILAVLLSYMLGAQTPRSVPLIAGAVYFTAAVSTRVFMVALLAYLREHSLERVNVAIYGAGAAGTQLATSLLSSNRLRPKFLVDDKPSLHGIEIAGLKVYDSIDLKTLIQKHSVEKVVLALPSVSQARRNEIVETVTRLGCQVQMLPPYFEFLEKGQLEDKLQTVGPNDLLERDKVDLDLPEVAKAFAGRIVMITGAGGSIGSELCRQLRDCRPRCIVLFEHSELALYEIERELKGSLKDYKIDVRAYLGSITDPIRVQEVMRDEGVEIVLHAAAYKHVPIVETNEAMGARNNVLGTLTVAQTAARLGIERFILVSSDKAVRPTNIMGATKRLAEICVQDLQNTYHDTRFSMVRFGNVLGSSGSVYPLFKKQIASGGPVTVTDPEVTRYFMTIPEAARLVLLAGSYSEGGDVFVLDMGQPQKIIDIAKQMIEQSGARVRQEGDATGIEIKITGLRPGEKLYEELLIDNSSLQSTPHEKILRAREEGLPASDVKHMLTALEAAVQSSNRAAVRKLIAQYVDGYHVAEHDLADREQYPEAVEATQTPRSPGSASH